MMEARASGRKRGGGHRLGKREWGNTRERESGQEKGREDPERFLWNCGPVAAGGHVGLMWRGRVRHGCVGRMKSFSLLADN